MYQAGTRPEIRAFAGLHRGNKIRSLPDHLKSVVWALLKLYAQQGLTNEAPLKPLERAHRTTAALEKVAQELRLAVFEGELAKALAEDLVEYQALPATMSRFAAQIEGHLRVIGAPGRKDDIQHAVDLVTASEVVRLALGSFYDEDLAELYPLVATRASQENSEASLMEISADAIRKKRKYLELNYPERFAAANKEARRLSDASSLA